MTLSLKLQILLRIPTLRQILKLLLKLILLLDFGKVLEERKVNLPILHDPGFRNCAIFVRYICTLYQYFPASLLECST